MTESEWRMSTSVFELLEYIERPVIVSRKLRLFACACCRNAEILRLSDGHNLIASVESYAEGAISWQGLVAITARAPRGRVSGGAWRPNPVRLSPSSQAQRVVLAAALPSADEAAWAVLRAGENLFDSDLCDLLRDIFGNPFRSVDIDQAWLAWRDATVPKLARAACDERVLPSGLLDTKRLAILADALEEAGCSNARMLGHLRGSGPHVLGCWVIDLLLGKE